MDFANYWFQAPAACGGVAYQIDNSLRFRGSSWLSWDDTVTSDAAARDLWTLSVWIKRGSLGSNQGIFSAYQNANNRQRITFQANNTLQSEERGGGVSKEESSTRGLFRDPSAWYHLTFLYDVNAPGGSGDYVQFWINGVRSNEDNAAGVTDWAGVVGDNGTTQNIGRVLVSSPTEYFNGYLAELHLCPGQRKAPTDFGEFDCNGVWRPIKYTGSHGTHGYYLDFSDPANIGADRSGNGNNFTASGFELTDTTSAGYDWMSDTPTTNWCTLSPLLGSSINVIKNGNLTISDGTVGSGSYAVGTIGFPQAGKYYAEATVTAYSSGQIQLGICPAGAAANLGGDATAYINDGTTTKNGSTPASGGATYTVGDVIGIAVDAANSTVQFFKNGSSQVTLTSVARITSASFFGYLSVVTTQLDFNFGQRPFKHTPPTGFNALNTANLPEPTIKDGGAHFNPVLYSGTGSSQDITVADNSGNTWQPDLVWMKVRNDGFSHHLNDAVRGAGQRLQSNTTAAETLKTNGLASFNTGGFTVVSEGETNQSGKTYVAWNWKANGAGSSNTDGTIPSTVSANPTAGFSIVTYTGTGANATVGHGLGVAPKFVIVKKRSGAGGWIIGHSSIGWDKYLVFETDVATPNSTVWQDTAPASTLFSVGTSTAVNGSSETFVAYCFSEVESYSKIGAYTGNGNVDGPFVYCGFRPAYVLIKVTNIVTTNWIVFDSVRKTYNPIGPWLMPSASNSEVDNVSIDFLSNGFKLRKSNNLVNGSGTYIFAAFAEHPLGGAKVSPVTAR